MGNLAGDSIAARDELLQTELQSHLLSVMQKTVVRVSLLRVCCWVMSSLCKGKPPPLLEQVSTSPHSDLGGGIRAALQQLDLGE